MSFKARWDSHPLGLPLAFSAFVILWFAIWTITVNTFVLAGSRFIVLPWCLVATAAFALMLMARFGAAIVGRYESATLPQPEDPKSTARWPFVGAVAVAVVGALIAHKADNAIATIGAIAVVSVAAYGAANRVSTSSSERPRNFSLELALLCVLVFGLYYFGHRPDWDDANYLNLAAKAPLSRGDIFQFDTMVGDGPHPIHLPTYRVQSYELLGATIAYLTGLEPVTVFHLLLPIGTLLLLASILAIVFVPLVGRQWFAAALFSLAYLYANDQSPSSWGMHGIIRFHQGKGALVTIIPLLATFITVRWFVLRQWIDLIALALLNVCAIGLSANGLFVGPAAIGFVALAFAVSSPLRQWKAALCLLPTLIYPALIASVITVERLALPSELTMPQAGFNSLMNIVGWHVEGLMLIIFLSMLPLAFAERPIRRAAVIYLPLTLCVVLNPWGWSLVSTLTGNLGFRIFWSIPAVFLAGAVTARILGSFKPTSSDPVSLLLGMIALVSGIVLNQFDAGPEQIVSWHLPDLRVPRADYDVARELALLTPRGCKALVPEEYAVWMSGLKNGPYLVAVRSLYLKHYRFSEPRGELQSRWDLFNLVNDRSVAMLPNLRQLDSYGMRIGLVAMDPANSNLRRTEFLESELGLHRVSTSDMPLVVWAGRCAPGEG